MPQPIISILIGLIPNCSSGILLIELFQKGIINFASLFGGLCASGGLGLLILYRGSLDIKTKIQIPLYLVIISLIASLMLNLIF